MLLVFLALLMLAIWATLLFFRGDFWKMAPIPVVVSTQPQPSVVAVIPARNEAEGIGQTIHSLLTQDYKGSFHIILVDDGSTDNTADIARRAAAEVHASERMTIISGQAPEAGWTGKLWAVNQGVNEVRRFDPEFVLLTDGDISHASDNLGQLIAHAQNENLDLVSLMVKLNCGFWGEKALIPAFVFFFFMLYPPRWAADPHSKTAAAAGGCMLVRAQTLNKIGGIAAIKGALIDDCALAAAIKNSGGAIRLYPSRTTSSTRAYSSIGEIWSMIARHAFTQLHYSSFLLLGSLAGLFLTYLLPFFFALFGHGFVGIAGLTVWLAMAIAMQPVLRLYGQSWAWGLALPFIALFYASATLGSALSYWFGRGGQWKGRLMFGS